MHTWNTLTNDERQRLVRAAEVWECCCNRGQAAQMAGDIYNAAKRIHDERDNAEITATLA